MLPLGPTVAVCRSGVPHGGHRHFLDHTFSDPDIFAPPTPRLLLGRARQQRYARGMAKKATPPGGPTFSYSNAFLGVRLPLRSLRQENCNVRFVANWHSMPTPTRSAARENCRKIPRWRFGLVCGVECQWKVFRTLQLSWSLRSLQVPRSETSHYTPHAVQIRSPPRR